MSKIKQSFLTIVIGLALAAGISYAATWTGPLANPPENNAPAPLNVSDLSQVKGGGLSVGSLISMGGIKIGNTDSSIAGAIRWTGVDFEGYDGTEWKSFTADTTGGGKIFEVKTQQFLSSGSFTVPDKVTQVWVSLVGGGGGGGGGSIVDVYKYGKISTPGGGGGSGQKILLKQISVSSGANIPVIVGAGGVSPLYSSSYTMTSNGKDGQNGGGSSFGSFVSVAGGKGGKIGVPDPQNKYYALAGLGGEIGGAQGKCSDLYTGLFGPVCKGNTSDVEMAQGGGIGGGAGGAGAQTSYGEQECSTVEHQTICWQGIVYIYPAGDGYSFGGGGGGGVGYPDKIMDSQGRWVSVFPNGGKGASGYVSVSWCPDGLVPVDGKIESGFCQ